MHTIALRRILSATWLLSALFLLANFTTTSRGQCVAPPTGLVAWWQAESNALDIISNNNGVLNGNTAFAAGEVGQAFSFNGSNSYVEVPDGPDLSFTTNNFSIEFWVQFSSIQPTNVFLSSDAGSGPNDKWIFWLNQGKLQFFVEQGGNSTNVGSYSFTPVLNQYYHLAVTRLGVNLRFYVDGTSVQIATNLVTIPRVNAPLEIGGCPAEGLFFNGSLDEVSIYDVALPPSRFLLIHNAGTSGKCPPVPAPPSITTQPTDQTVSAGQTATFSVTVNGDAPLSYQWLLNQTNITDATNSVITLTNVQLDQVGTYSVFITNAVGSVLSSNAALTVNITQCTPIPAGLVAWWQAEGSATDTISTNDGILHGSADFVPGKAGQAFSFNGINSYVEVPDSTTWAFGSNDFTIELWVRFHSLKSLSAFVANDVGAGTNDKWIFWLAGGNLQFFVQKASVSEIVGSSPFTPILNQFYHLAVTRAGHTYKFYVNGALVQTASGSLDIPDVNAPLVIGGLPVETAFTDGSLDEVSIYHRALTSSEIALIYSAGGSGKCVPPPIPPSISSQPVSQIVNFGQTATFSVTVTGDSPLAYHWLFKQTNLVGTSSVLTLTNVQLDQAGVYSVQVTNAVGSILSSNAALTVNIVTTSSPPGMVAWWQGENDVSDAVGTNNGVLLGNASFVPGEVGEGFRFNGADAYAQMADSPDWNFDTNDFSIELWVRFASIHQQNVFLANDEGAGFTHKWFFWINSGVLQFTTQNAVFDSQAAGSYAFTPVTNQFYHVALTRAGSAFTFYINGVAVESETNTLTIPNPAAPLTFGGCPDENFFTDGTFDEVTIYHRALTPDEVATIYNDGAGGKPPLAPTPLSIITQPFDRSATVGQSPTFRVTVSGSVPRNYQWQFDGTNILNATNAVLTLTNVQLEQAGAYSVQVSNSLNSVLSLNAMLSVRVATCTDPGTNLVGWWRAEGDASDSIGTNDGIFQGGASIVPGYVGQGFGFNGIDGDIQIPDNPAWAFGMNDFTIEFWVCFNSVHPNNIFLASDEGNWYGTKWIFWLSSGALQFYSSAGNAGSYPFSPETGRFYHIAVTRRGNLFTFYVDGVPVQTETDSFSIPDASAPLTIGGCAAEGAFMDGTMDEISIYNRALTANEITNIYYADSAGKCVPPVLITAQPAGQSIIVGQSATFGVIATGGRPLSYQWLFNGTNIVDGTNALLNLDHVTLEQAGNYSVLVGNSFSSVLSSNALLTLSIPVCTPPPTGLVSWWRAEGDATDAVGPYHGTLQGGATLTTGQVGQGFGFDGVNGYVQVPDSAAWAFDTNDFTIELWVRFNSIHQQNVFVANDEGFGFNKKWLFFLNNGTLQFFTQPGGWWDNGQNVGSYVFTPATNEFYHLALTRTGNVFTFYINGVAVDTETSSVTVPDPDAPLTIGGCPDENMFTDGTEDEVSIYHRGLTSNEILSIYNSTGEGKCPPPPAPPSIFTQPTDTAVFIGGTPVFTVLAIGTEPLSYQWRFNGMNIDGATNSTFSFPNAQRSQAGNYSVFVTNELGSAISSNALLFVDFPPATVEVGNTNTIGGTLVTVPIRLLANGNEAAFGFSLQFDPGQLTFVSANPADSDPDASIFLNTNLVSDGYVGIAVIPTDVFSPGTQDVVEVTFLSHQLLGTYPTDTGVYFADNPVIRELIDPDLRDLSAFYFDGDVTINPTAFEGDVSPRPNGNQTVSTADWLQAGRFVARLDTPSTGSEFQRVDSAPIQSQGDGQLKVTDWVQTGRYFSGKDPLSIIGGPTSESSPTNAGPSISRLLYASGTNVAQGQSTTISVKLNTQGNENAVGFTLGFDPTAFTFGSVTLGSGMSGVNLIANTSQAGTGKLGVVLALSPGNTFAAGTKELVKVNLTASPSASGAFPLTLTDLLVTRCVSDALANELPVSYIDGSLVINAPAPPPFLTISQANSNVIISWPLSASNFVLQICGGTNSFPGSWMDANWPLHTNGGQISVMTSVTNQMKFFRLHR